MWSTVAHPVDESVRGPVGSTIGRTIDVGITICRSIGHVSSSILDLQGDAIIEYLRRHCQSLVVEGGGNETATQVK